MPQPGFVCAQGMNATPDRRHVLAEVEMEALDTACGELPAPLGQDGLDGLCCAKDDAVLDLTEAPAPVGLDDLRIEQPGLWHPTRLGLGTLGLATPGWHPLTVMRDQRGEVLPKAVGQKPRGTVRRQHLSDLMDETWRHGQGVLTDVNGQDELADWGHRHPHPVR